MRKALYILGQLNDSDVEWLAHQGTRRRLADGEVIIREGHRVDALFITRRKAARNAAWRPGDEAAGRRRGGRRISFVDSAPPSATVAAIGDAMVLALSRSALQDRLAADEGFAARFYRALAIFLADRLRTTTRRLGYGGADDLESDQVLEDELDIGVLDAVSQAGDRYTRLLRTLATG